MKRDMMKTVSQIKGKVPTAYELNYLECLDLAKMALKGGDSVYNAVHEAFLYGFVLGARCEKKNPGTVTGAKK